MASIASRLNEALVIRGLKQSDIVERTGIGKSSISTYLTGEYEPKQKNLYLIARALDVSEAWLLGLDVPMERHERRSFASSSWAVPLLEAYIESPVARREAACDVLRIPYVDPDAATQDVPPSRPGVIVPDDAPHHTTGEEADAYTDREDELREMEKEPPSNVG